MEVESYQFDLSQLFQKNNLLQMTQPIDSWTTSTRIELVMWNGERFVYFMC